MEQKRQPLKISELIILLEEIKKIKGDCTIQAFHHEGENSLRAYPENIDRYSFVDYKGILTLGGYYKNSGKLKHRTKYTLCPKKG